MLDNLKLVATASAMLMSMCNMSGGSGPANIAAAHTTYVACSDQTDTTPTADFSYAPMQLIDLINRQPYLGDAFVNDDQSESNTGSALTDEQRDLIERVVMASCGNLNNPEMAEANAQVIKDRTDSGLFGDGLMAVLTAPCQFESPWKGEVNAMVKQAVSDVFDKGERVTDQPIYYYVNPNVCSVSRSSWSRGKTYVTTIGSGRWVHEYWTKA